MGAASAFIEIADFSAGIVADRYGDQSSSFSTISNHTAGPDNESFIQVGQNGPATIDQTYGCFSDKYGALCPLPRGNVVSQASWAVFEDAGHTGTTYFPAGYVGYYLLDARILSGITDNVGQETWVAMSFGCYLAPGNDSQYRQLVWTVIAGIDFNRWEVVHWERNDPSVTPAPVRDLMSCNIMCVRSVDGDRNDDGLVQYDVQFTQNSVVFMFHQSPVGLTAGGDDGWESWATGAIPANEIALTNYTSVVLATDYPEPVDSATTLATAYLGTYPDPRNISQSLPRYVGSSEIVPGFMGIEHQSRIVIASHSSRPFGHNLVANTTPHWLLDRLYWSPPLNPALCTDEVDPDGVQYPSWYNTAFTGDDNLNQVGTLASLSANELLVVKHGKGGTLLHGDLDNYEAINLPYIESTYDLFHHGIGTPLGWVYGSKNGIFVWNGGDTTEKLSKQIDGFFWDHTLDRDTVSYRGNRGRFGYMNPFLFVPNDYVYCFESNGWWRLENADDATRYHYNVYDISAIQDRMYAFEWKNEPGSIPAVYSYDLNDGRETYSWKSHPLVETRVDDRLFSIEQIDLIISTTFPNHGRHQVTVTLEGYNQAGTAVTPVSVTHIIPTAPAGGQRLIRLQPTAFVARYIQVRVLFEREAGQGSFQGPAPKLHRLAVGYSDRARQPVTT